MSPITIITGLLATASLVIPGSLAAEATDMGAAAFLWPPDRAWGAAQDRTAPCGSSAGVTNRTEFPLTNGAVSLVLQTESYSVNLAISYDNNPTSNSDFSTIVSSSNFPDLDPGHECYSVPNPPSTITTGSNATLQLKYVSDFDNDGNETYYACADITYVPLASFDTSIPCFNVSEATSTDSSSSPSSSSSSSSTSSGSSSSSSSGKSGSSGLSKGAIAGIVVGTVVGAALVGVAAFVLGRYWQKKAQREHAVAMNMMNPVQKTWSASTAGRQGAQA
ncbi:hypothetical protein ASPACDRAFT_1881849 [Aspergillus aculeatus ATCC 16872]|uniref:Copper acquisition factor BIM1-like domain-containing protein n=1 Tax=Aspergillus aculeatus (strain ATCC 16872 / CBS 172.66 / WB 5094) TaxID=690307 RepID=A0A1L9WQM3_ASPA1|nr:uncharacterized protein ASPACDRAFT_1881849 [Aspergillus aculeatus ATCC 16872]OJJ98450.1 hypothetical protein ASPACDRAFT_1881849 [Aspergillus aculeatus ATCC 16872]